VKFRTLPPAIPRRRQLLVSAARSIVGEADPLRRPQGAIYAAATSWTIDREEDGCMLTCWHDE
jgi:hypothetical protein